MPEQMNSYDFIKGRIETLKTTFPSLRNKPDSYIFSVLAVKSTFYQNPALELGESEFNSFVVDGQRDGGVDILLSDPNSETSDLVIGQSKFQSSISSEDVTNAMLKMAIFYKEMLSGHYETVNENVHRRFLTLNSEIGDESKIHFVFYTSANIKNIRLSTIEQRFKDQFSDSSNIEVSFFFAKDLEDEIKESESRRPNIESGKITIDKANNILYYGDDAAMANISAFSIKELYANYHNDLLAMNLRYHIRGTEIDRDIENTIKNDPEFFWHRNNGITIICDKFEIDGIFVKLYNFSIINGGQTTYKIYKSKFISRDNDLFLPCKIITTVGNTLEEKNDFSLEIAKAANSQKPIKKVDLKANSSEQLLFVREMRNNELFYQTKRGEKIPPKFKEKYLNSNLVEIGKLCLSAIFQLPCKSRSNPSSLYSDKYYNIIFQKYPEKIAKLCKEFLYIDHYFKTSFIKRFDQENSNKPKSEISIPFAHNSRTICLAFTVFASRYYFGSINNNDLNAFFSRNDSDTQDSIIYNIFSNLENLEYILPSEIFSNKSRYDEILYKIFMLIINAGIVCFSIENSSDSTLNATNYLKKDKNYYKILNVQWTTTLEQGIKNIFENL